MTEGIFFNLLLFVCVAGLVGWVATYRTKGRDLTSFEIVTLMVLAGRKSK